MPILHLSHIAEPMWPETYPYVETVTHDVTDRDGARRVLRAYLDGTADPAWGADILAAFDSGENSIFRPNGIGHAFMVKYKES